MWPVRTPEDSSALKRKAVLTPATTWTNLEDVTLSEVSQTQKDTSCLIPLTGGPWRSPVHRTEKMWESGGGESVLHGDRVSVWEHEKVLGADGRGWWPSVSVLDVPELRT